MKYLYITHDLGKDESGFMAVETTLSESDIYEEVEDSDTYLRINNDHPNFAGLVCEVCKKVIESGWENIDHPRQSVCDDHTAIVNP